jgi:hypothetical protein
MKRLALAALLLLAPAIGAQQRVVVTDRGPGGSGELLESILARPHRLVSPDTSWYRLRRGDVVGIPLVVLDRTAAIEGTVNGDVVVVGGDLFLRPGSRVTGRAIAIGGGVYPSALAVVGGGTQSFRDNSFTITQDGDGFRLAYQALYEDESPPLLFPGVYGLRMPAYDRVNGVSLPFGPSLSLAGGRVQLNALATYRSDLGKIDPSVQADVRLTRRMRAQGFAGRGTFSNEAWIWSNLVNSFSVLTSGDDSRNYFRADRAELTLHRLWEWTNLQLEPFVGALAEDAWSVGPAPGELRGPWSLFGRNDTLAMLRPNPSIGDASLVSALAGARLEYERPDLRLRARTRTEVGMRPQGSDDILLAPSERLFAQITTDVMAVVPTFGEHEYALDVHWVTTADDVPRQRFVYLGGPGTLVFLEMLEQEGDELLLVDQRYSIPVPSVRLGLLGEPTLILRHRIGSAGLGKLPAFEQVVGVGVLLTLLRIELQVDPVGGKARLSTGFSFSR